MLGRGLKANTPRLTNVHFSFIQLLTPYTKPSSSDTNNTLVTSLEV